MSAAVVVCYKITKQNSYRSKKHVCSSTLVFAAQESNLWMIHAQGYQLSDRARPLVSDRETLQDQTQRGEIIIIGG